MAELDKLGPICQSCAMPIENDKDAGTEKNGKKSKKYCHYCYKDGKFTNPDLTVEQMIEHVIRLMMVMKVMEEDKVQEIARTLIPTLDRWNKGSIKPN